MPRHGTLVAVNERVVLDDMEEVGRGFLEQVIVQELAAERRLRHGNGRMQQADVANARLAARNDR